MNQEYIQFYDQALGRLQSRFPSATRLLDEPQKLHQVISPFVIELPKGVLERVSKAVEGFWSLSRAQDDSRNPWQDLRNNSVLMAYDFHVHSDGDLRLIEINTNASGFLLSSILTSDDIFMKISESLWRSFVNEWRLIFGNLPFQEIVISDKNLAAQKMFAEFLMYQDFFSQRGVKASIVEWADLQRPLFVYNRHTDFYLEDPDSQNIRNLALSGEICLSPSPKEYFLLADKRRLAEWSENQDSLPEPVRSVLLKTAPVSRFAPDELWAQRKSFFFKPENSFGGKSVYKGASITRGVFDRLLKDDFLAQEAFPPGTLQAPWKFDVRFYVYQNQIQWQVGRVYQGQLTNFKSPFGGFALVHFA